MGVFGPFSASPGAGAPPRCSRISRLHLGGAPAPGEAENGPKTAKRDLRSRRLQGCGVGRCGLVWVMFFYFYFYFFVAFFGLVAEVAPRSRCASGPLAIARAEYSVVVKSCPVRERDVGRWGVGHFHLEHNASTIRRWWRDRLLGRGERNKRRRFRASGRTWCA